MKKGLNVLFSLLLIASLVLPSTVSAAVSKDLEKDLVQQEVFKRLGLEKNQVKAHSMSKDKEGLNPEFEDNVLVVKYSSQISKSTHKKMGTTLVKKVSSLNYDIVKVNKGNSLEAVAEKYAERSDVISVSRSARIQKLSVPDQKRDQMYYLDTLKIDSAQKLAGKNKVRVAVVDSGIDVKHPELKNKIVSNYNVINPIKKGIPDLHGTHVAGIIASEKNNGVGGYGINPNVSIISIDVFGNSFSSSDYTVAEGILQAVKQKAQVINLSLGSSYPSPIIEDAINQALAANITVVAAAGNSGMDMKFYPAAFQGVISVGATNDKNELADFSTFGGSVDIVAPGQGIYNAAYTNKSTYMYLDGTSMATPVVTGTVSLLLSKDPKLKPHEIQYILNKTAKDLGAKGYDTKYGFGLVNPVSALKYDKKKVPKTTFLTESQLLSKSKKVTANPNTSVKGQITKLYQTDWYRLNVTEGEYTQLTLSPKSKYDYMYELYFFPEGEKEPLVHTKVDDIAHGGKEGSLFQAPTNGTIVIGVKDASKKYNEKASNSYTLSISKTTELPNDGIAEWNPYEITSFPFQSKRDFGNLYFTPTPYVELPEEEQVEEEPVEEEPRTEREQTGQQSIKEEQSEEPTAEPVEEEPIEEPVEEEIIEETDTDENLSEQEGTEEQTVESTNEETSIESSEDVSVQEQSEKASETTSQEVSETTSESMQKVEETSAANVLDEQAIEDSPSEEEPIEEEPWEEYPEEDGPSWDTDHFMFTIPENANNKPETLKVKVSSVPGINIIVNIYELENYYSEDEDEYYEDRWLIDSINEGGTGQSESFSFNGYPGQTYIIEVTSDPNLDPDFWWWGDEVDITKSYSSTIPYELSIDSKFLPDDEDNFPNGQYEEDQEFPDHMYDIAKRENKSLQAVRLDEMTSNYEEDDYYSQIPDIAIPTKTGQVNRGYIQYSGDEDWYALTPKKKGFYQIDLSSQGNIPVLEIYTYDEFTGQLYPVASNVNYDYENDRFYAEPILHAGLKSNQTYYFFVTDVNQRPTYDEYQFTAKFVRATPKDIHENNDTFEEATRIGEGKYRGYFETSSDNDIYYFSAKTAGIYGFNVKPRTKTTLKNVPEQGLKQIDPDVIIVEDKNKNGVLDPEEEGSAMTFFEGWTGEEERGSFYAKKNAKYFIVLYNYEMDASYFGYDFTISNVSKRVDEDKGNKIKNSKPTKPVKLKATKAGTFSATGYINPTKNKGDTDYYRIVVDKKTKYKVELNVPTDLDGVVTIYNSKGKKVTTKNVYGQGDAEKFLVTLKKGTYYVKIHEVNGNSSISPYKLKMTKQKK